MTKLKSQEIVITGPGEEFKHFQFSISRICWQDQKLSCCVQNFLLLCLFQCAFLRQIQIVIQYTKYYQNLNKQNKLPSSAEAD